MIVVTSFTGNPRQIPSPGDLALAGSLLGVAVLSGFFIDASRPDTVEPSAWWHWALMATPPILVAFRRINPVGVVILATAAQAAIWISGLPEVLLSIVVLLYTAVSEGGRRGLETAVAASVALTVVTAIGVGVAEDVTLYQLPLIVLTCGTAIALGANADRQRRLAGQLATTVAEARLRSENERTTAVAEERSHIARELHDVIGHTLSVIAVRAEAADRVAERQPEAAGDAVADIATAARSALRETRRVLAGLRKSAVVELTPPPDLAGTRRLVTDLAAGGMNATLIEGGCDEHPPPAVIAGGAHRIVQESLTNAIKHGGPAVEVEVRLDCRRRELRILITNTVDPASAPEPVGPAGAGLAGMAERAAVLGGHFDAGMVDGRFVVSATLPTLAGAEQPAGP